MSELLVLVVVAFSVELSRAAFVGDSSEDGVVVLGEAEWSWSKWRARSRSRRRLGLSRP